jgi:hypothetical protein
MHYYWVLLTNIGKELHKQAYFIKNSLKIIIISGFCWIAMQENPDRFCIIYMFRPEM